MAAVKLRVFLFFLGSFSTNFLRSDGFTCSSKDSKSSSSQLQIHMVPHTHDDVGWLKTVDQYYYGANNSIAHAGVQYILDSVIPQLVNDPSKKFIYVEMAFFKRWWDEQSDNMKDTVKKLVKNKQLEFINGGWCMNDEAATHYNAIIDQMTLGLKFIQDTFGSEARPRVAWHIDPFGHSAEQASLFAQMSFEGFFFARIDYQDKEVRKQEQRLEMIWHGSKNLGKASEIFTGVTYTGYGPPKGFCFDGRGCTDPPIQDDPKLFDMNVKERVDSFIKETCEQAEHYKSGHIMLTMGEDFNYENANLYYKNMDKLIKYVNKDGRVNAFYSTPSLYVDAVSQSGVTLETKTDDFFPYADCPHCYWTGYFTSRPTLKGYVRKNNNLLQVCKQLEAMHGSYQGSPNSATLREAMGVAQHHDAVSGTAKQHVTNDYALRLAIGQTECQALVGKVLDKFSTKVPDAPPINFSFCNYLNISACSVSENSKSFTVTLYNPLVRDIISPVMLPVLVGSAQVKGPQGELVSSQILPISQETSNIRGKLGNAKFSVHFEVKLPALGFATYFVELSPSKLKKYSKKSKNFSHRSLSKRIDTDSDVVIENKYLKLVFSSSTGHLTQMINLQTKQSLNIDQEFLWYNSSTGTEQAHQESGAYIFRPNASNPFNVSNTKIQLKVFSGPLVQEVRQIFSPYISQVVRLYTGQSHAEFEYSVGPIPIGDGLGKEIISRFNTDIKSNSLFYTDANGREMQERKLNYRPTWKLNVTEPVAGNYYPVNSRMFIKDDSSQFTVMTDRSLGGASLKDGSLEIMVHRRTLKDDQRGVGEPLNETAYGHGLIARGKFFVLLTTPENAGYFHRTLGEQVLLKPELAFAPNNIGVEKWLKTYKTLVSGVNRQLPENVHLLTLETMDENILIRVEHQFEQDEDSTLSKPVSFSLKGLFTEFEITSMTELNLSANQLLAEKKQMYWKTKHAEDNEGIEEEEYGKEIGDDLVIELKPMQIRTFKAAVTRK